MVRIASIAQRGGGQKWPSPLADKKSAMELRRHRCGSNASGRIAPWVRATSVRASAQDDRSVLNFVKKFHRRAKKNIARSLSQNDTLAHPATVGKVANAMEGGAQTVGWLEGLSDEQLTERAKAGDLAAFELLMRRHNQRLYRLVRAVLRRRDDVEDAMQEAYLAAFRHLAQFEGRAQFGTWLLKIGINEARARIRRPLRAIPLDDLPEEKSPKMEQYGAVRTPEQHASRRELGRLLETAIDRLPDEYRQVFVLRIVDSLDSAETAEVLEVNQATIRQRLHRARGMLRADINRQAGTALETTFNYPGPQCDGMVARVMRRIAPDGTEYRN
jgi:RNA polymerase sigma-70 factor (ECF subfamily)